MKGGADIDDQMKINRAVQAAVANGESINVTALAASLNIAVDCCQSFVDYFAEKHGLKAEVKPKKEKASKKEVTAEKPEDNFFESGQ